MSKDTLIFNKSLINKKISKDSARITVKIFDDSIHFKEVNIPFFFLFSK